MTTHKETLAEGVLIDVGGQSGLHEFVPSKEGYGQFCETCGYGRNERLKHGPAVMPADVGTLPTPDSGGDRA